ncbi:MULTISPECIES: response regulator transcription factor [unclassified Breznakia]|uniref:response regulator transcription factor n=1 Tax=unclassified Breznakia TaxID=2623764 RepID=UPI0024748EBC|nr:MULTISPECIES: response regulator transcription factor [unclassified Breznakia]MDH6367495.1 DNA-binding response OmpR family regulator [Breznakia sp. PH1-1]MDH6404615.1 DNA-binding response OmpR family regulator [Breznakia sp. PF1-11]MDH6412324.1 DNA-binding response OmpR family regulator [Breznakia sp. PFB1-11]MDH6414662.1 DNA-binding response OmpR family regulator [Breznakia sp. PFB1-14]MDH6416943.1 DNA-binding response OmpR family regulator [Breznakia sp. PFB1-4]
MEQILLVEDDRSYGQFLTKLLTDHGYSVDLCENPIDGIEQLTKHTYDLVISDLVMPDMNGVRFTKAAKNIQANIKTIILTANPDDESEVESINNQIDLYMVKEKGIQVILKYIRLVLDRKETVKQDYVLYSKANQIELNQKTHQVYKEGEVVNLTRKEYELLAMFLQNKGNVLSREELIESVWMMDIHDVEPRVVDVHIKNLRDKLRIFSLVTIRGFGYKWNE